MSRYPQPALLFALMVSACSGAPVQETAKTVVEPVIPSEYQEEVKSLNEIVESYHQQALPSFDAKHARTHTRLGIIFFNIGNFKEAKYNLERAINMHSGMAEAHFYLGRVLNKTSTPREALEEYDRALKIDPGLVEVHKHRGETYKALGMEKKADVAYQAYRAASSETSSDSYSHP